MKKIVVSIIICLTLLFTSVTINFNTFALTSSNEVSIDEDIEESVNSETDARVSAEENVSEGRSDDLERNNVTIESRSARHFNKNDFKVTILPNNENSTDSNLEEVHIMTGDAVNLMTYIKVLNNNISLDNANLVVSLPKKYVQNKPRISGFNGKEAMDISDEDSWKFKIDIGNVRSGSNIGIPMVFSQNNRPTTTVYAPPKGEATLVTAELLAGEDKISEDTFSVVADRRQVEDIQVNLSGGLRDLGEQSGDTVQNSPAIGYNISIDGAYAWGNGSPVFKRVYIKVELPEDAQFPSELWENEYWTYHEDGHYITKELNFVENYDSDENRNGTHYGGYSLSEGLYLKYDGKPIPLEDVTLKANVEVDFYSQDNKFVRTDELTHGFTISKKREGNIYLNNELIVRDYKGRYIPGTTFEEPLIGGSGFNRYIEGYTLPNESPAPIIRNKSSIYFNGRGFNYNYEDEFTYEIIEYIDELETPYYDINKVSLSEISSKTKDFVDDTDRYIDILKKVKVYAVDRNDKSTLVKTGLVKGEEIILPDNTIKVKYVFDEEPMTIKREIFSFVMSQEYKAKEGLKSNSLYNNYITSKAHIMEKGANEYFSAERFKLFKKQDLPIKLHSSLFDDYTSSHGAFSNDTLDVFFRNSGAYITPDIRENYVLRNPKFVALLPEGFEYVKGSSSEIVDGIVKTINQEPEVIYNYKGTGKTALVYNLADKLYYDKNGFKQDIGFYKVKITNAAEEKKHEIEHFFTFVSENPAFMTDTTDKFDLNENGLVDDKNTAESKVSISLKRPRSLYISNQVSSDSGKIYSSSNENFVSGSNAKIKINVENLSDTTYNDAEIVSVLPFVGDKKLDGSERGSSIGVKLTGPINVNGYKVFYSMSDPSTLADPYTADFVDENAVRDFSKVRLIKFVADQGVTLEAYRSKSFEFNVLVDENALQGDEFYTTAIIKTKEIKEPIEGYRAIGKVAEFKLEGIVFADREQDGILSEIDKKLEGYTVALLDENDLPVLYKGNPITAVSDESGKYSLLLPSEGNYKVKLLKKNEDIFAKKAFGTNTTGGSALNDNGISDVFTVDLLNKKVNRNLGITWPTGKVFVRYIDENGNPIKDFANATYKDGTIDGDVLIEDMPTSAIRENFVGERYSIEPKVLNYEIVDMQPDSDAVERKDKDDAPAVGIVEKGEKTVTFVLRPKTGSITKRVIDQDGNILKSVTIFPEGTPIGSKVTPENRENAKKELGIMIAGQPFYMNGKNYSGNFNNSLRLTLDGVDVTSDRRNPIYRNASSYGQGNDRFDDIYEQPLLVGGNLVIDYVVDKIEDDFKYYNISYEYYDNSSGETLDRGEGIIKDEFGKPVDKVDPNTPYKYEPPSLIFENNIIYKFVNVSEGGRYYPLEGVVDTNAAVVRVNYNRLSSHKPFEILYVDENGNNIKETITPDNLSENSTANEFGMSKVFKLSTIEKDEKLYLLTNEDVEERDDKIVIINRYKQKKVEVNFVDEKGNPIKETETFEGEVAADLAKSSQLSKDGKNYTFVEETKTEKDGNVVITRVYKENKVKINYKDNKGNTIKDSEIFDNSEAAEASKVVNLITNDKVYTFVEEVNANDENIEGTTVITRIYKSLDIKVNFVDENGNAIKDGETVSSLEEAKAAKVDTIGKYSFLEEKDGYISDMDSYIITYVYGVEKENIGINNSESKDDTKIQEKKENKKSVVKVPKTSDDTSLLALIFLVSLSLLSIVFLKKGLSKS